MDRLRELLNTLWSKIVSALKNFENSSVFERIMRRFENMTPRGQSTFKGIIKAGAFLVIAFMILGGPFILLSKLSRIKDLEKLESKALIFQAEYEALTKGYSAPAGWRPLASSSASELAAAFNEYLPSIGVPEEFGTLTASGDSLNLTLREVSIRQVTNIIFQLEGLYPKVSTQSLSMRPNTGQRDILDMEASFKFNPAYANQISTNSSFDSNQEGGMDEVFDAPSPPTGGARNTPNLNNNGGSNGIDGDFQNDYVPPPPPGDYDDLSPPEIPDDLPPPPPPGFEEEP